MRTTSVKDISTVMNAYAAGMANNAAASGASFQDVWDSQAGMDDAVKNKAPEPKTTNHQEEALKARETVRKEPKEVERQNEAKPEDDVKDVEEAMEVLGTAANEMMQQVADTLGMSMEELQELMAELNMSTLDILNADKLSMLLLQAAGAEDTLALLTNEALYADYTDLMNTQQQLLAQAADEMQLSKEQLAELLAERENVESVVEEPIIELSVEGDELVGGQVQNSEQTTEMVQKAETKAETGAEQNADNQTGNLLLQTLKENMTQAAQATQTSSVWDADTQNIIRQIMDYMKIQVRPEVSDLEMQLHPANLGTLRIHVSAQGGTVTANFITENEAVKAALESQMIQLKESFAEQGVKVDAIEVTVQTHEFERNLEQGQNREQGETEKKSRTRRINLNAPDGMEDIEEMAQEDVLAAEMMAANGNTVDFTA